MQPLCHILQLFISLLARPLVQAMEIFLACEPPWSSAMVQGKVPCKNNFKKQICITVQ